MKNDPLKNLIKGDVVVSDKVREQYSHDTSLFEIKPEKVVFPKDSDDVKKLVKYATDLKKHNHDVSLTARSGGTDMSGGAINESLIVVFEKYFKKTGTIRGNSVWVEPGVFYRNFEKKTLKHGKIFPSYPASREICAVGGIVANNSGGEKSLEYGKTEDYVNSIKVVLADGNEYEVKPLNKKELEKKIAQKDFEGNLYKEVFKIVEKNYDEIKKAAPPVSKNSTAYSLWRVWDRETGIFDMTQLFIGSQGTLGLITDINLKLVDYKARTGMLVGYFEDMKDLGPMINTVLKHKPSSFEAFDDQTIHFAFKFFLQFRKTLGYWNFIKLALSFIPDAFILLRGGIPKMIVLAEFEGDDLEEISRKLHELKLDLKQYDMITELAPNKNAEKRFWLMRRESFNLLRKNVKNKHTAPFIDDLIVPPQNLPEFLPELDKIIKKYDLLETIAGHLGDGNFHIIPLMDLTDESEREKIEPCLKEVIALVKKYDGSISGEHNDGLIRGPFIKEMYGPKMFEHFKAIKEIFDPLNIFNPHKKTDSDWKFSKSHIRDKF